MNSVSIYYIGEYYRYPKDNDLLKLTSVEGFIFRFECGHWCTDSVFKDLIRHKTGMMVCDDNQLEIQFNN